MKVFEGNSDSHIAMQLEDFNIIIEEVENIIIDLDKRKRNGPDEVLSHTGKHRTK